MLLQTGHDECMSSIVPGGQAGSVVLGSNFMRQYFSAFYAATAEQPTSRIALAKATPSPDAAGMLAPLATHAASTALLLVRLPASDHLTASPS